MSDQPNPTTGLDLRQLRRELNVSQAALAEQLGTSQQAVLKAERSNDPRLSTVRKYVEGLGRIQSTEANLELVATIDNRTVPLVIPKKESTMQNSNTDAIAQAPSRTTWRLRAWDDADLQDRFRAEGIVAIGGNEIGDLTEWPSDETVAATLRAALPDRSDQAIGTFVRYWKDFRRMQRGDLVVVPIVGRRALVGEITSDYRYDPSGPEPRIWHQRSVRWFGVVSRGDLDDDLRRVVNSPGTICQVHAPNARRRLLDLFGDDRD